MGIGYRVNVLPKCAGLLEKQKSDRVSNLVGTDLAG